MRKAVRRVRYRLLPARGYAHSVRLTWAVDRQDPDCLRPELAVLEFGPGTTPFESVTATREPTCGSY
jgi:hypothetical protein